jgi:hypothetical protein
MNTNDTPIRTVDDLRAGVLLGETLGDPSLQLDCVEEWARNQETVPVSLQRLQVVAGICERVIGEGFQAAALAVLLSVAPPLVQPPITNRVLTLLKHTSPEDAEAALGYIVNVLPTPALLDALAPEIPMIISDPEQAAALAAQCVEARVQL